MENQKEKSKVREELIINLESASAPVVILSQPELDMDRGITDNDVRELQTVFGNDVGYISAKFVRLGGGRRIIEEIELKRKDGSKEKRRPSHEENEALVRARNIFKNENSIVVPRKDITPLLAGRRKDVTTAKGEVVDLQTGTSRPMTDEEIAEFLDYINKTPKVKSFFADIDEDPDFDSVIDSPLWDEIDRTMKEMLRRFFEGN